MGFRGSRVDFGIVRLALVVIGAGWALWLTCRGLLPLVFGFGLHDHEDGSAGLGFSEVHGNTATVSSRDSSVPCHVLAEPFYTCTVSQPRDVKLTSGDVKLFHHVP